MELLHNLKITTFFSGRKRVSLQFAKRMASKNVSIKPGESLCNRCFYKAAEVLSAELELVEDESILDVADEADMDDEFLAEDAISCTQALSAKREFDSALQAVGVSPVHSHGQTKKQKVKACQEKVDEAVRVLQQKVIVAFLI